MIVVAIAGVLAAIAVPAYQLQVAKARQSEAKANLAGVFDLEVAFHGENNTYGSLAEIGFIPDGASHYTYCVGDDSCIAATVPLDYGASTNSNGVGGGQGGGLGGQDGTSSSGGTGEGDKNGNGGSDGLANNNSGMGMDGAGPRGAPQFGKPSAMGNGHRDGDSFEADAFGRISAAPAPNDIDSWMISDSRELLNTSVGY